MFTFQRRGRSNKSVHVKVLAGSHLDRMGSDVMARLRAMTARRTDNNATTSMATAPQPRPWKPVRELVEALQPVARRGLMRRFNY